MTESRVGTWFRHLVPAAWGMLRDPEWYVTDARWERDSLRQGVFDRKNLLLFGDSQVARWPLRRTFARLPVRARGLDGDLAEVALSRFEQAVLPLRPTAALILLGTNDLARGRSVTDIAADLRTLARRAVQAGIRPTICSVLPVGPACEAQRPTPKLRELNLRLRGDCGESGVFYLDLWDKLADESSALRAGATFDGLHPNLEGYRRMTEAVLEVFYCRSGQWKRGAEAVW